MNILLFITAMMMAVFAENCPKTNTTLLDYMNQFQLCLEGIQNCEAAGVSQEEARKILRESCGTKEARLEEVRCAGRLVDLRCSRI